MKDKGDNLKKNSTSLFIQKGKLKRIFKLFTVDRII